MKNFLVFVSLTLLVSCGSVNNNLTYYKPLGSKGKKIDPGMPTGPGCYAKCLISDTYSKTPMPIVVYTGTDLSDPNVEYTSVITQDASTNWVKKKADKNCMSANPDDCLVWCLQEVKEEKHEYYTVIDTNVNKQFVIENINFREVKSQGGYTEWREVICENKITPQLYSDIQESLITLDYISENDRKSEPKFTKKMKAALVSFQKDNELPEGQLDLETLDLLLKVNN